MSATAEMDRDIGVTLSDGHGNVLFEGTTGDINDAAKHVSGSASGIFSAPFPIPDKEDFDGQQFLLAPTLKDAGDFLIEKYEADFHHLNDANIIYLWKEKGGETGGMATLGKCVRPTGLAEFFACSAHDDDGVTGKVDYIIWAAADHLRNNNASMRTVSALIFHELCHTHWDDGKLVVKSHEFEGFAREITEFGIWTTGIKKISEACLEVKDIQQGLFANMSVPEGL